MDGWMDGWMDAVNAVNAVGIVKLRAITINWSNSTAVNSAW
jgi:hypothetical protein